MKQKKKAVRSTTGSVHEEESDEGSNPLESSSEKGPQRRPRRDRISLSNSNDFRVKIPKFEGKFDPNDFCALLHMTKVATLWSLQVKRRPKEDQGGIEYLYPTLMILELKSQNLKASLIRTTFVHCYTRRNESFITKKL